MAGELPTSTGDHELRWSYDDQVFFLSKGGAQGDKRSCMIPILEDRLFLLSTKSPPVAKPEEYFITLNKRLQYIPFCADFGPYNLGTTFHVVSILKSLFKHPDHRTTKVIYYTTQEPTDVTNGIYLLGSFLCLYLNATPDEAFRPFAELDRLKCLPFRDATWSKSTFDLHVKDCWSALQKASETKLFDVVGFDKNQYFYYDDPENGEFHEVVPGKFIAFRGPSEERVELMDGSYTLPAADYVGVFESKRVTDIVRLNSIEYDANVFRRNGFIHHDLFFEDCSTPDDSIVDKFLRIAEEAKGIVAVHCLAGLGRTGTLIALYLMKHHLFTARQAIAWLRISRPGSVIGPQQQYLEKMQDLMYESGREGKSGFLRPFASMSITRTRSTVVNEAKTSGLLADMVTVGMINRAAMRARGNFVRPTQGDAAGPATGFTRTLSADTDLFKPNAPKKGDYGNNVKAGGSSTSASFVEDQKTNWTGAIKRKPVRPQMPKTLVCGIARTRSTSDLDIPTATARAAQSRNNSTRNGSDGLISPGTKSEETSDQNCAAHCCSPTTSEGRRTTSLSPRMSPQSARPPSVPRDFAGSAALPRLGEKVLREKGRTGGGVGGWTFFNTKISAGYYQRGFRSPSRMKFWTSFPDPASRTRRTSSSTQFSPPLPSQSKSKE